MRQLHADFTQYVHLAQQVIFFHGVLQAWLAGLQLLIYTLICASLCLKAVRRSSVASRDRVDYSFS